MYSRCRPRGTSPIGSSLRMSSHQVGALIGALALPSAPGGGSASATAAWSGDTARAPVHARHSRLHFHVRDGTCAEHQLWHARPLSLPRHAADRYSAEMSSHQVRALIGALALRPAPCGALPL